MKSIIDLMYEGEINEAEREIEGTEYDQEEDERREALVRTLTKEQEKLFDKFCEASCMYYGVMEKRAYERGLKTGVWLGIELCDFSPSYLDSYKNMKFGRNE